MYSADGARAVYAQQKACSGGFGGALLSLGRLRGSFPSPPSPLSLQVWALGLPRTLSSSVSRRRPCGQLSGRRKSTDSFFILKLIPTLPAWVGPHQGPDFVQ